VENAGRNLWAVSDLLRNLKKEYLQIVDEIESYDYGEFVHIMDPEGNKIELWEPNDIEFENLGKKMNMDTTK
jgi:hypothetical protein